MHSMKVSPRDILFIFFSKLHVMIGVFLIVVTVVTIKTLRTTPVYQVSAAVLIRPIVDSRLELQQNRFSVDPLSQEDVNSEIKLIISKQLMRETAQKLGLLKKKQPVTPKKKGLLVKWGIEYEASAEDKAINSIRSDLDVSAVSMSNMIQITKNGSDPAEITKIVNTIIDCYIDLHIEAHKPAGSVKFYSTQVASHRKKVIAAEEELKEYQKGYFIINPEQQEIHNIKLLQLLQQSLIQLQVNIAEQQSKLDSLKKDLAEHGEITSMTIEYRNSQVLSELAKGYVPLLVEQERIALLYPKSSVEYQDMASQTEQFRREILKEERKLLNGMELDLKALVKSETVLFSEVTNIKAELSLLKEKEIQLNRILEQIEWYKKNYRLYMDKVEEARSNEQREEARAANIFISNWASEPSTPVFPNVKARLQLALLAGLMAGIGAALAAFYLDHTIKRPEDLEKFSGVPMLSSMGIIRRC